MRVKQIHPRDNVAVALEALGAGETVRAGEREITLAEPIPRGHKFALCPLKTGDAVIKYGCVIGYASQPVIPGGWVHSHNLKTGLSGQLEYTYTPKFKPLPPANRVDTFSGYLREDGRAATRNEIWIIPTVGCVCDCAASLATRNQDLVTGSIDGLYAFSHPYGCSQTNADHARTRKLLCSLARHPNAGAVLVVGLGCENLTHEQFLRELGPYDPNRIMFLTCQEVEDEMAAGRALLEKLAAFAARYQRQSVPVSKLVVGLKCGGSDGLSGITANPTVGAFSDQLIREGGSTILTEVPEMFGAEQMLMDRCVTKEVFDRTVAMVNGFKEYFLRHGEAVSDNPSPGNREGGITTLEDKSCGCIQKGGTAPVVDVLDYGDGVRTNGLNLLYGPGNDLVSSTALAASGAHMVIFTTGRGTPFGCPVPTVKVSSNAELPQRKKNWIDFDASVVLRGASLREAGEELYRKVLSVAGGEQTSTERAGFRQIAIFKDGVTL